MPKNRKTRVERSKFVSVRITEEQHEEIGGLADRDGISVSEWLRTLVIAELRLYRLAVKKAAKKHAKKRASRRR
jgi:hypothetical protein